MKKRFVVVNKKAYGMIDEFFVTEVVSNFNIYQFTNEKEYDAFIEFLDKTETEYLTT